MADEKPESQADQTDESAPTGDEQPSVDEPGVVESSEGLSATQPSEETDKPSDTPEASGGSVEAGEAAGGEAAEQPTGDATPELTLGSGASAEQIGEPVVKAPAVIRGKIDRFGVAMGTGRRKTAVARVRVKEGSGELNINGRRLDEYFAVERDRRFIEAPLRATETLGKVDVWVRVNGGGTTGQAGAVVLGLARALEAMNPDLHTALSGGGYLTRDDRMVERKKYGFKKARRSFQFSKR